ncbi:MAG: excinuclease ABC subunit UvrC [Pseudomonadota bacterium]
METEDFQYPSALSEKAAQISTNPGVYLMKDNQGSVIYVGKAKSLHVRVRSYFQKLQDSSPKTRLMVSRVADFEIIVTPSEKDALLLENNLIKKYRPRYNVVFRDDKEYPYLRISTSETYPNLTIFRKPKKDGSLYFGPFASPSAVRETVKVIQKIFPLRKCSGKKLKKARPCIYYQLGQCPAPCCCNVDPAQYRKTVKEVQLFLQGRSSEIVKELKKKMAREATNLNFELAARLRDRLSAIEKTLEKQTQVCLDFIDRDVFSFYREDARMAVTVLFIRTGRMMGSKSLMLNNLQLSDEEALGSCISQYYYAEEFIPREIIVPLRVEEREVLEEWLREKRGAPVEIICPQRGAKRELLTMAARNAEIAFSRNQALDRQAADVLKELHLRLHLKKYPSRIACLDISNIMGTSAVGSMVTFEEGLPVKDGYRKFRIQTVGQPDDYAMMHEVLTRYLSRSKRELTLPDLIIVDGGKGQLNVLCRALSEQGITSVDATALAKGKKCEEPGRKSEEKIFLPHRKNPVLFPKQSPALLLLQRIRDEAHRFAISYHKLLKKKKDFTSPLQNVPGLGKKTAAGLLRHFGSIDKIRKASQEELLQAPLITQKQVEALHAFFQPGREAHQPGS